MSTYPCEDAECLAGSIPDAVDTVILPRTGDIGGFEVARLLPSRQKRLIGPFVFWDEMGPGTFSAGQGLDVRPHPHIGLSTLTYLFDGSMEHRDSLGIRQTILPGEVNLMTAGRGIVHSERTGADVRQGPSNLYGIQSWLALPKSRAEIAPAFRHYGKAQLPTLEDAGVRITQIMGYGFGMKAPVHMDWDTFYAEVHMVADACLAVPTDVEERGIHIVSGHAEIDGESFGARHMISLKPGAAVTVKAETDCHMMFLGGAALDGPRYVWWNFVSSSKDRIREAAEDWEQGDFAVVPGDEEDVIPAPDLASIDRIRSTL